MALQGLSIVTITESPLLFVIPVETGIQCEITDEIAITAILRKPWIWTLLRLPGGTIGRIMEYARSGDE